MKAAIRHIVANTYRPLLVRYLSKEREYKYEGMRLRIPPEVFHPRFFFSTSILLRYVQRLSLHGKTFLEPGCGSALISFCAARRGAIVTASDINPIAVDYAKRNADQNALTILCIHSDMFARIPVQQFDYIAINPPYYKKNPRTLKDHAWYCGENGEYFERLFEGLAGYIHDASQIVMVLFEGCDMQMISDTAVRHGFEMVSIETQRNLLETNYLFKVQRIQ